MTIKGTAAGTAAVTLDLGDLVITDSDANTISSVNGTGTLLTLDNASGVIGDNEAVLTLDAGGALGAAGSNVLRVEFTGTDTNKPMLVEVIGGGKDCSGLSIDADPTVNDVALIHSDAVIAADKGVLRLTHATGSSAAGSAILRITESAATPDADARALEIDAQFAGRAMYVDSNCIANHACEITHTGNMATTKSVLLVTDAGTPDDATPAVIHAQFTGTTANQPIIFADGGGKDVIGLKIDADTTTHSAASAQLLLSTDHADALGGSMSVHHNSATPAAEDQLFAIHAYGEEATSSDTMLYGQMTFESAVVTENAIEGAIKLGVADGTAGASNIRESFWLTDDTLAVGDGAAFTLGSNGSVDLTISTAIDTAGVNALEPKIVMTDGASGDITITAGGTDGEIVLASPLVVNATASYTGADEAIPATTSIAEFTTDGDGTAHVLADGVEGQFMSLIMISDGGGNAVISPTNLGGYATITLNNAGETAFLQFTNGNWYVLGSQGATIA